LMAAADCDAGRRTGEIEQPYKAYAIDPLANPVCPLHKYPAKPAAKMRSWASHGKRVKSMGNWVEPNGDYLKVFMAAYLELKICS